MRGQDFCKSPCCWPCLSLFCRGWSSALLEALLASIRSRESVQKKKKVIKSTQLPSSKAALYEAAVHCMTRQRALAARDPPPLQQRAHACSTEQDAASAKLAADGLCGDVLLDMLGTVAFCNQLHCTQGGGWQTFTPRRNFTSVDVGEACAAANDGEQLHAVFTHLLGRGDREDTYRVPTWKVLELAGTDGDMRTLLTTTHLSYREYMCARHLQHAAQNALVRAGGKVRVLVEEQANMMSMLPPNVVNTMFFDGLQQLNLTRCVLGVEGSLWVGRALELNITLVTVKLGSNALGKEGGAAIARALAKNASTAVRSIDLYDNVLGPEGVAAIAGAVAKSTVLTEVNLGTNNAGCEGAAAMADALGVNSSVTHLYLDDNGLGARGGRAMVAALHKNNTLACIDMRRNRLGPSASALRLICKQRHGLKLKV